MTNKYTSAKRIVSRDDLFEPSKTNIYIYTYRETERIKIVPIVPELW